MPQPNSPRTLRGGLVILDAEGKNVERVVTLQYNPDALTRSLQPRGAGADTGDRLEALRLKGPPVETIKLEAEIDAADSLETPDRNQDAVKHGILPELAAIETVVSPRSGDIQEAKRLADQGTLEILPLPSPLVLFVWGEKRVLPVRITEFSIIEEAFDPNLNPIRAKVTLGLRVLSVDDLPWGGRASGIAMAALQTKERLVLRQPAVLQALGLKGIP
jgi:hypothetical protein